jgi:hypothetical protein
MGARHADVVSIEDREFVREELAWLAEWIRSHTPNSTLATSASSFWKWFQ